MKYVTVQEMIAVEKAADCAGHSYAAMMEAAGKGLAEVIDRRYRSAPEKTILALVGSGNNGGDTLVALDYLSRWGWKASAVLFRPRSPEDELVQRLLSGGGDLLDCSSLESLSPELERWIGRAAVILDGVLGTGIKLPLRQPLDQLLGMAGEFLASLEKGPAVVAVDCPSGVDCDTGEVSPACIAADLTVTMAAVKQGLLRFPAYNYLGELELVEIGLPDNLAEWDAISREVIEKDWVREVLPARPPDSHKGTFGTCLVIAGSQPYPGAAALAGISAYRAGAGLVTMAVPQAIYSGLIKFFPEGTWVVLEDQEGGIAEPAVRQVSEALAKPTACLIGPGLGTSAATGMFLAGVIDLEDLPPLVVDADGLRLLALAENWERRIPGPSVLTPHPGEMAALSGLSVAEIQSDRVRIAEKYSREWGQIILLKGAHTVIASPEGQTRILLAADPALSRAGSGDVLAGIICGLLAQGVDPFSAACAGAWLHARAGSLAAKRAGSSAAVLAGDISAQIGLVLGEVSGNPH